MLTPESEAAAKAVLQELANRPVADIIVIGHTDTKGEGSYRDIWSRQRAQAVRDMLIARGGDPARIVAVGHGEREPKVVPPDEAHKLRNRRAVYSVC